MQRTIWWAALTTFSILCLLVWATAAVWDRTVTLERAQYRMEATAQLFEQHAARALDAADRVVVELARVSAQTGMSTPDDAREIGERAHQLLTGSPVASAWVLGADGAVVADSWSYPARSAGTYADRDYFQTHKAGQPGLYLGPVQVGSKTKRPRFTISRGIVDPEGRFEGVAVAGVFSEYFADIYRQAGLGEGAVLKLMTDDGKPLATWPLDASSDGGDNANITVKRVLGSYPASISISIPKAYALSEWYQRTAASGLVALGVAAAFAGLTALGLRTARKEWQATAALRDANEHLEARVRERTAALAESEGQITAILEHLPIGVGVIGTDGVFRRTNPEIRRYVREMVPSRDVDRLSRWRGVGADGQPVPPNDFPGSRALRGEAVLEGHDFIYIADDGSETWVRISAVPLRNAGGDVAGVVIAIQDIDRLKRTAEALSTSEAQLRLATEGAGVGTWEMDMAAGVGRWSPQAVTLLRVQREAFSAKDWMACVHPADKDAVAATWAEAVRSGHYEIRFRVFEPSGEEPRWVQSRGRIEFDPDGKPLRGAGVVFDVTEQVRAEAALTAGEDRLRLVADAVPALVSFVGPDQCYRFVNRSYEQWFGRPRDTVEGYPMRAILGDEAYGAVRPYVEAALRGERVHFETLAPYGTGGSRFIEAEYIPNVTPAGRLDGFFVFVTDVTQRKVDEAALRESEQRLQLALAAGQLGDWTWDAGTDVMRFSTRACEIFGVKSDMPLTWAALMTLILPEDGRRAMRAMDDAVAARTDYSIEYRVNRPDGRQVWVAAQGRPTYRPDGSPIGMAGIVRDVTDRHEAEEHQRMLINELNHRVKNTLATVQSIAAQSLKNAAAVADARQSIESRLIALSRSHDLLTNRGWEGANLKEVAAKALEPFVVEEAGRERLRIEGRDIWLKPNLALAFGMAFHELATNAAKYGALSVPTGRLSLVWSVESRREGDHLLVRWEERGGPPVKPPARKGFGTRLIQRGLAFELGGTVTLSFEPTGVVCTIDTPSPLPRTEALAYV